WLRVGKCFVDELDACDAAELLTRSDAPLRVYHSDVDETVPASEGKAYLERCREIGRPCELVRFTSASHDFIDYADRERLLSDSVDFLEQCLTGEPAREARITAPSQPG